MNGNLTPDEIESILEHQIIGRIGCHSEGKTYIIPISYAYNDGVIYLHTQEGMKINMMRKNSAVCFQVDEMTNMANWKSVTAWGEFEELNDIDLRNEGIQYLTHRHFPASVSKTVHLSGMWPFELDSLPLVTGLICKITLSKKSGRFENDNFQTTFAY